VDYGDFAARANRQNHSHQHGPALRDQFEYVEVTFWRKDMRNVLRFCVSVGLLFLMSPHAVRAQHTIDSVWRFARK